MVSVLSAIRHQIFPKYTLKHSYIYFCQLRSKQPLFFSMSSPPALWNLELSSFISPNKTYENLSVGTFNSYFIFSRVCNWTHLLAAGLDFKYCSSVQLYKCFSYSSNSHRIITTPYLQKRNDLFHNCFNLPVKLLSIYTRTWNRRNITWLWHRLTFTGTHTSF